MLVRQFNWVVKSNLQSSCHVHVEVHVRNIVYILNFRLLHDFT